MDKHIPMFGTPIAGWQKYFCWYPVDTLDNGRCWMTTVYRRRIQQHYLLDGDMFWWQYIRLEPRTLKERIDAILKEAPQ